MDTEKSRSKRNEAPSKECYPVYETELEDGNESTIISSFQISKLLNRTSTVPS